MRLLIEMALALAAGILSTAGFAPLGWWPVPILGLAVLFHLWRQGGPGSGLVSGLVFGLGFFGAGLQWIPESLHGFASLPAGPAWLFTGLFILLLALFPAASGLAVRLLCRGRRDLSVPLLCAPAAFVLTEWLRGWVLTGFPWLSLGYSQLDTPLAGLAPLAGIHAVSLGVALTAGVIATNLSWLSFRQRLLSLLIVLLVWFVPALLRIHEWTHPLSGPLTISLVQGNIPQRLKWAPAQRLATEDLYMDLAEAELGRDLVILPETALPEFASQARPLLDALAEEARKKNSTLLLGIPLDPPGGKGYYNAALALGASSGSYRKRHLVPFGEYLPAPFRALRPWLETPMSAFRPGARHQPPIRVAGVALAVSICYEDAFSPEALDGLPGAGLLVNLSNDGWFGRSTAPYQHLDIARMRALEAGRPLVRAANTGISAIIDYRGHLIDQLGLGRRGVLHGVVQPRRGATPYVRLGQAPLLGLCLLALLAPRSRRPRLRHYPSGARPL